MKRSHTSPTPCPETLRAALEAWWDASRRDLPWRRRNDPYAIWVSEVMLQQTRSATVVGYYRRFLDAFPTVEALADANLSEVLKAWEGMGYYARARNLHAAARHVVSELAGRLPRTARELRRLPGVGPYTAAAVASIAFGADEPVLDGNVVRVLCRLYAIHTDPAAARTRRRLARIAGRIVAPGRAGLINQALMDLGATLCRPRKPHCSRCPLRRQCRAFALGRQEKLPIGRPRKPTPHYDIAVAVVRRRGRLLISRRKPEGLLGGLWELPGGKPLPGEPLPDAAARETREETGVEIACGAQLAAVRHAFSHFRITLYAFLARHLAGRARPLGCTECKWVFIKDLDNYAFPAATRKVLAALRSDAQ